MTHPSQAGPEPRHLPAPPSECLPCPTPIHTHFPSPGPGPIHMGYFCLFGWLVFRSVGPAELVGFDVIFSNLCLLQWKLTKQTQSSLSIPNSKWSL